MAFRRRSEWRSTRWLWSGWGGSRDWRRSGASSSFSCNPRRNGRLDGQPWQDVGRSEAELQSGWVTVDHVTTTPSFAGDGWKREQGRRPNCRRLGAVSPRVLPRVHALVPLQQTGIPLLGPSRLPALQAALRLPKCALRPPSAGYSRSASTLHSGRNGTGAEPSPSCPGSPILVSCGRRRRP